MLILAAESFLLWQSLPIPRCSHSLLLKKEHSGLTLCPVDRPRFWSSLEIVVVQSWSRVQLFVTPWTATHQASLSFTISLSLLRLMSIESLMAPNHLLLCHSLLLQLQSFPASGSFPMGRLFASGSQSIRVSASVLPIHIQGWFPLGLIGLVSLLSKGLLRIFSSNTVWKHQYYSTQTYDKPCR